MDKKTFEHTIRQNWTSHFGYPVETAQKTGVTLLPESKYDGDKIIVLWHIENTPLYNLTPSISRSLINS
ncbi:MAG: hypothetical protein IPN58_01045 [Anaerolineales bacterium]|nr:hypothetical protein [Anaerolineales bacterium]